MVGAAHLERSKVRENLRKKKTCVLRKGQTITKASEFPLIDYIFFKLFILAALYFKIPKIAVFRAGGGLTYRTNNSKIVICDLNH